jgi:hypothetical protein
MFPIGFSEDLSKRKYDQRSAEWLAGPLFSSWKSSAFFTPKIEQKIFNEEKNGKAVLLNCLDDCFGHVFYKLLNIQLIKEKFPNHHLIVVVPVNFEWLLPNTVDEIWLVQCSMKELRGLIQTFDYFDMLPRRFTEVILHEAHTHLDQDKIKLEAFLKTSSFNLELYDKRQPKITFILREDRFLSSGSLFLEKLANKTGWTILIRWLAFSQNSKVRQIARQIQKAIPDAQFHATGIGKTGTLGPLVHDYRNTVITEKVEREWCKLYAHSHLVIGIHGSNMLIPTALAAGFIILIPEAKIPHYAEDSLGKKGSRLTLFLGRYFPLGVSKKYIAIHATRMITDFKYFYRNLKEY